MAATSDRRPAVGSHFTLSFKSAQPRAGSWELEAGSLFLSSRPAACRFRRARPESAACGPDASSRWTAARAPRGQAAMIRSGGRVRGRSGVLASCGAFRPLFPRSAPEFVRPRRRVLLRNHPWLRLRPSVGSCFKGNVSLCLNRAGGARTSDVWTADSFTAEPQPAGQREPIARGIAGPRELFPWAVRARQAVERIDREALSRPRPRIGRWPVRVAGPGRRNLALRERVGV